MSGQLLGLRSIPFEQQVKAVELQILDVASKGDVPSDVLAAAMADVLARIAARQDLDAGRAVRGSLQDRLHEFLARVEGAYRRSLIILGQMRHGS